MARGQKKAVIIEKDSWKKEEKEKKKKEQDSGMLCFCRASATLNLYFTVEFEVAPGAILDL